MRGLKDQIILYVGAALLLVCLWFLVVLFFVLFG